MSPARLPASGMLEAITPASATPRTDPRTPIHPAIITATITNQPALRTIAIAPTSLFRYRASDTTLFFRHCCRSGAARSTRDEQITRVHSRTRIGITIIG